MDDFATLPGGIYIGGQDDNLVNADADLPGSFDNLILTFGGEDTVNAGQGDDAVLLGSGDDLASGGTGNDTVLGQKGDDSISGDAGDDVIEAGKGDDVLSGGDGEDLLGGGDGDDLVAGGSGADVLVGGEGKDTLFGGSGGDTFVFESGFGKDVVLDFQKGVDTLQIEANINGLGINSPGDLAQYVSGNAVSAEIKLGGDTIKLVGVSKADLLGNLSDYVKIV